MGKIIGIDLGTTNSAVAIMDGKDPKIITNEEGGRLTPSVVAFDDKGDVLVGQVARRQAVTNPQNTIFSAKRLIGRRFDETQNDLKRLPYTVVKDAKGSCAVEVGNKKHAMQQISAHVLKKLKRSAEEYLGESVTDAVITVPAYFNDTQRQATKEAGKIAGLDVKRIVNEPTAAALAYGLNKKADHLVAVYDFGGGTFDISVLEVGEKVVEVISTNGDTHLGGDDIDDVIVTWLIDSFKNDTSMDLSKDKIVLQRLKEAAEKAKVELSSTQETEINLPFLTADASGPKHLVQKLSRAKLNQIISNIIDKTITPCKKALQDADKKPTDIHEVILVGGSTRIPLVQEKVKAFFGKDPHKGVNPDEVVALGAAVQAGVLSGDVTDMLLLDVTPLSLAIETLGSVSTVLIPRNTTIPTRKNDIFSTAADNQPSVEIHVTQGERQLAKDNRTLGRFNLDDIPPAPRGVPKIEVAFDIDANGILNVTATDKATSKEQKITIESASGLSDAEIEKMVEESETYEEEDKKRKEGIEARNNLDSLIYNTDKLVTEHNDKLSESDKGEITNVLDEAKTVLESNQGDDPNTSELQSVCEQLEKASHKLAEVMYKTDAADSGNQPMDGMDGMDNGPDIQDGGTVEDAGTIDVEAK